MAAVSWLANRLVNFRLNFGILSSSLLYIHEQWRIYGVIHRSPTGYLGRFGLLLFLLSDGWAFRRFRHRQFSPSEEIGRTRWQHSTDQEICRDSSQDSSLKLINISSMSKLALGWANTNHLNLYYELPIHLSYNLINQREEFESCVS